MFPCLYFCLEAITPTFSSPSFYLSLHSDKAEVQIGHLVLWCVWQYRRYPQTPLQVYTDTEQVYTQTEKDTLTFSVYHVTNSLKLVTKNREIGNDEDIYVKAVEKQIWLETTGQWWCCSIHSAGATTWTNGLVSFCTLDMKEAPSSDCLSWQVERQH